MEWIKYEDEKPPLGEYVLGYSKYWEDEECDGEDNGIRIGFQCLGENSTFLSADFIDTGEQGGSYVTCSGEEDKYNLPTYWTRLPKFNVPDKKGVTIESDLSIDDTVFCIADNKIQRYKVIAITLCTEKNYGSKISYRVIEDKPSTVSYTPRTTTFYECRLGKDFFKAKQELIESL